MQSLLLCLRRTEKPLSAVRDDYSGEHPLKKKDGTESVLRAV